jgi:hypothetical protein
LLGPRQKQGGAAAGPSAPPASSTAAQQEESDALLAASLAGDDDEGAAAPEWQRDAGAGAFGDVEEEEEGAGEEEEDEGALEFQLPLLGAGEVLDIAALAALPTSMQFEFITRMREQQTAANREKFQAANDAAPSDFSTLQLDTYLQTGRVKRQLNALVREGNMGAAAAGGGPDALRAQRIAGDTVRPLLHGRACAHSCAWALHATDPRVFLLWLQSQEFVFSDRYGAHGRGTAGAALHAARSPNKYRQISAPPSARQNFGTLHAVLPPPLPGTLTSVAPPPALPLAAVQPPPDSGTGGAATVELAAALSALPDAPAVEIAFEVPAVSEGDSGDAEDEWEDVDADAPGAGGATMPVADAAAIVAAAIAAAANGAADAGPRGWSAVAASALAGDGDDYGSAFDLDASDGSPQQQQQRAQTALETAAPLARQQVYKRSHGFMLGRNLADWEGEEAAAAAVPAPEGAQLAPARTRRNEEDIDMQLAIRQSLADAGNVPARAHAASGVVISLLDDDDDDVAGGSKPHAIDAHAPPRIPASPPHVIIVDDDRPSAAQAGVAGASAWRGAADAGDDAQLQAALAASLAPPAGAASERASAAVQQRAVNERAGGSSDVMAPCVTVHFQARVWTLSIHAFTAAVQNLSRTWPEWLPSPIDLEEQPVLVACAGEQWNVDTPMGASLLGIARAAAAAAARPARSAQRAAAPPRPAPAPSSASGACKSPAPPHSFAPPPRPSVPAAAAGVLAGSGSQQHAAFNAEAPAWSDKWEGVVSEWRAPVPPQRPRPPNPPPASDAGAAAGQRAATAEEEAWLAAEEQEAAAADHARQEEQLEREREALRAEHRSAARAADTVTPDMYTEVQELLTMFGIPYIIAPAEAEAQCAWLDAEGLVDGVVTDDSDVFLFGARTVYRNIFESKKFVEVYLAERIQGARARAGSRILQRSLAWVHVAD